MRPFIVIFAPVWGVVMAVEAVRSLLTATGHRYPEFRVLLFGVSVLYVVMAVAIWKAFTVYLKKKP
jgi:hypothetical protein